MTDITCTIKCAIVILDHGRGLEHPAYGSAGAAGMDIPAAIKDSLTIPPGARVAVETGFRMQIPEGYEAQIRPRSGLAIKHGLTVANAPGTIDCDYRGEVKILLVNLGHEAVTIKRGDRIAQMVFAPVTRAEINIADSLDDTGRGEGGFGSTGMATMKAKA